MLKVFTEKRTQSEHQAGTVHSRALRERTLNAHMLMITGTRFANCIGHHVGSDEAELFLETTAKGATGGPSFPDASKAEKISPFSQPSHLASSGLLSQPKNSGVGGSKQKAKRCKSKTVSYPGFTILLAESTRQSIASNTGVSSS